MVELESSGGVARVFLSRPEKANALSTAFLEELFQAIAKLKGDPDLRVVVLAGRGKAFCGGADVNELKTLDESSAPAFVEKIHRVCRELRALPVPVVAQLHGAVIGAGLEIAAACDLRVAAEGTKFSMPEVKIGIPSVVEAALLPRLMGSGRAAWMVLTGEPIDARRAYEWGLIEKVSANLEGDVDALVKQIVSNDRKALRLQKELLQRWEEAPLSTSVAASLLAFREAHRK
ncbi:MAG TPA: enoyl-CoA hydratase-related protein [Burkholderiales bacterium]|jgi:enoyl-CoA hydratase/carnithine racemase|nr:enoyl-CoA hydratase-related protein [Burkholderiales bacterium]